MKQKRPAASRSAIVAHYLAVTRSLAPGKVPTFQVGVDFCYLDEVQGHVAIGNLHKAIVQVAKVSGAETDEVLRALFAWKGLSSKVTTAKAKMQADVAAASKDLQ